MWCALAGCLAQLGRLDEAVAAYRRAAAHDDPDGLAGLQLARLLRSIATLGVGSLDRSGRRMAASEAARFFREHIALRERAGVRRRAKGRRRGSDRDRGEGLGDEKEEDCNNVSLQCTRSPN